MSIRHDSRGNMIDGTLSKFPIRRRVWIVASELIPCRFDNLEKSPSSCGTVSAKRLRTVESENSKYSIHLVMHETSAVFIFHFWIFTRIHIFDQGESLEDLTEEFKSLERQPCGWIISEQ